MSIVTITGPYSGSPTAGFASPIWVDASTYALTAAERAALFAGGAVQITQPGNMVFYSPTVAFAPGRVVEVNEALDGEHRLAPDVAVLADGTFVVTWADFGQEATRDYGLAARRYTAAGDPIGAEFRVNTYTAGDQADSAITALAGGGYVIAWSSVGQDGSSTGVYLQAFQADGAKSGAEQQVNTETVGAQLAPEVAPLSGGGFVVTWTSAARDIHAQLFDGSGVKVGAEAVVNATVALDQTESAVAGMSDGGFVVAWTSQRSGTAADIMAQRFDAAGDPVGVETLVNTYVAENQTSPGVAALSGGRYVVAWLSTGSNTQAASVYSQMFDASGNKVGGETAVSYTYGEKGGVSVRALADGGYLTLWHVDNQTIPPGETTLAFTEVYAQRYDANGMAVGGEIRLNSESPDYQLWGAVGAEPDGSFVAAWQGKGVVSFAVEAAVFAPVSFLTLSAGADTMVPQNGAWLVTTTSGNLTADDSLVGGLALDRLDLLSGGVLDLTAPAAFSGFDVINLSSDNDQLIGSAARLAGIVFISGGAGSDVLDLVGGGVFDFTQTKFSNLETIRGSSSDDIISLTRAAQNITLQGGAGTDVLQLTAGSIDLSLWKVSGFETIRLGSGGFSTNNQVQMTDIPVGLTLLDGGPSSGAGGGVYNTLSFGLATAGANMGFTTQHIYTITGSAYADVLRGGDDGVIFNGGDGDDVIYGGAGNDTFNGGPGHNTYFGGGGGDTASAGVGEVITAYGGDGSDRITGGAGDDFIDGGQGDDVLNGGAGVDMLSYATASAGVTVNLSLTGLRDTVGSGRDILSGFENLTGSAFDDTLTGASGDNILIGGLGSDSLNGGQGEDQLYGGAGNDTLRDGGETTNRDFLYGGAGNDTYFVTSSLTGPLDLVYEGGANPDLMAGAGDIDVIHSAGTFFWDYYGVGETLFIDSTAGSQLVGGTNNQQLFGGAGSDQIIAYGGSNYVDAGAGTDAISFGLYGLDASHDGINTLVMKPGNGLDYVYEFQSGVDKIDLTAFHFGITGQQVLDQAVNVDNPGTANDYCYFYLTNAGGVDNYVAFIGLLANQLQASDFIT